MITKCKTFNNCDVACSLMLDDLSYTATTLDNKVLPSNDWGYNLKSENSLFNYFAKNLLIKYPEIKGTIFFPISDHCVQNSNSGYHIKHKDIDNDFKDFIHSIDENFELAFHGINHGRYVDQTNPSLVNNWNCEFEYFNLDHIQMLSNKIQEAENKLKITFKGGKYPGYKNNSYSEQIIEDLGFKWWAASANMLNKRGNNDHRYFGNKNKVLDIPTNLSGDCFKYRPSNGDFLSLPKKLLHHAYNIKMEHHIDYLSHNQKILTIQEHFQNLRTDGFRQTPNLYDDINSLDRIFEILRSFDTWYATCSEIAHFCESYDFTDIIQNLDGSIELKYQGRWPHPFLSAASSSRELQNLSSGQILQGIYKKGVWIYNNIPDGKYKEL